MNSASAGPSTVRDPELYEDLVPPPTGPSTAPLNPLPPTHFYSVEYPGYVKASSVPLAIERLGGQHSVEIAFKRTGSKSGSLIEMNMSPGNPFSHPIPGDIVSTNNILLKVTRRKRKVHATGEPRQHIGEYTVQTMGSIPKTVRFRSMADYQYQPDAEDPVAKLRLAMGSMDVESILAYRIPEEKEDYTLVEESLAMDIDIDPELTCLESESSHGPKVKSNLKLPPPPLFSRQAVPHIYNYKANTASVVSTTVDEETGEEKKRLINRMRWKGLGPTAINFSDRGVPDNPSTHIERYRGEADQKLLKRLGELFQERPVWTRTAIFNQFDAHEVREIINSKYLLPLVSYVFTDGPWRDTQLRLGYDPRADPEARFYQRLYFRNTNHTVKRPSVITRRQELRTDTLQARTDSLDDKRSHIFDGETLTSDTAAFQLCDLQDPMLKDMVEDDEDLREECDERTGWYSARSFERIKTVLRHKFFLLNDFGEVVTREECEELLERQENGGNPMNKTLRSLRSNKHNMAKGALRPEDAIAKRLKATIDQRTRGAVDQ